jgi:hypothetical protein
MNSSTFEALVNRFQRPGTFEPVNLDGGSDHFAAKSVRFLVTGVQSGEKKKQKETKVAKDSGD